MLIYYPMRIIVPIFFVKNFVVMLKVTISFLDPRLVTIPLLGVDDAIVQFKVLVLACPMAVVFPVFLVDRSILFKEVTISFQLGKIKNNVSL